MATNVELNQLVDYWQDGATQTMPSYGELTSTGFAQAGDPVSGVMATRPGAAWFNLVAAMRVSVIRAAGLTPSATPDPLQFLTALQSLGWAKDKSITGALLADAIITAAKLANGSVETAKIKDAAVTASKLAALAVETGKIAAGAVTSEKIASKTIAFDRLAASAIATEEQARAGTANNVLLTPYLAKILMDAFTPPACPTGMIAFFDLTDIPDGWLLCDGSAVSRTTFAALFAEIGTRHGAGDGSTTFNLPDMNSRFLEGTTDTGQVGTKVEAGLPNITGSFNGQQNCSAPADWDIEVSGAFVDDKPFIGVINAGAGTQGYGFSFDASKSNQIYGETLTVQPPALRCLACIKV
jgi:hypothetical protein